MLELAGVELAQREVELAALEAQRADLVAQQDEARARLDATRAELAEVQGEIEAFTGGVSPGSALGGFGFSSTFAPLDAPWTAVLGSGQVVVASTVPDTTRVAVTSPATAALTAGGVLLALGGSPRCRRRRRR